MAELYRRKGSPYYQARLRIGGKVERISTGCRTRREAQETADIQEKERNALIVDLKDMRLTEAAERFFQVKSQGTKPLKPRTIEAYKGNLINILRVLGDFPLLKLDKGRLEHYVETRRMETGDVAIRRDLAFLSSLYTTAKLWPNGPQANPVKDLHKRSLQEANERTTWLTQKEYDRLLAACREPYQRIFVTLAVHTGMRKEELLKLRWEEIDLEAGVITLGNRDRGRTKNGSYRIIPMTDSVLSVLEHTLLPRPEFVFTNPETGKSVVSIKTFWRLATKRAKLSNVRIHDLRHTFASWAMQRGVPEIVIQSWLGHRTRSMTKRYAHPSLDQLKAAAKTLGASTNASTLASKIDHPSGVA